MFSIGVKTIACISPVKTLDAITSKPPIKIIVHIEINALVVVVVVVLVLALELFNKSNDITCLYIDVYHQILH